ncbi:MAG: PAS domain S-box protein, partial [Actinomycetota bacterium]|nr:PAS domain S-box protein [Actinomycetota bacterium]
GMDLTDRDGHFLQVNTALCRILGYSEGELLGMRWQDLTHPDDLAASTKRQEETFEGHDVLQFSKRYLHKSGRVIWCRLNSSLVRDAEGRPRFAIAQLEDISRQRELEHQLIQAQKMEAVGRLAGGIAHDFNNLLLVINNYAQMLRDDMTEGDPRREDLDEIVTAGSKAARLVQQLLAFSRRDVVQAQLVSLNQVIDGLLGLLPRTIGTEIELTTKLEPELWDILMDVSQLEQIIVNLAVNARDAMPDGGHLEFTTSNLVLDEPFEEAAVGPGRYVQLTVVDDGRGIKAEVLAKMFEPFFTTKPRGEGSGLGLASVYGIVEQAGGLVDATSEPGRGATIRLLLPAVGGADDA